MQTSVIIIRLLNYFSFCFFLGDELFCNEFVPLFSFSLLLLLRFLFTLIHLLCLRRTTRGGAGAGAGAMDGLGLLIPLLIPTAPFPLCPNRLLLRIRPLFPRGTAEPANSELCSALLCVSLNQGSRKDGWMKEESFSGVTLLANIALQGGQLTSLSRLETTN